MRTTGEKTWEGKGGRSQRRLEEPWDPGEGLIRYGRLEGKESRMENRKVLD